MTSETRNIFIAIVLTAIITFAMIQYAIPAIDTNINKNGSLTTASVLFTYADGSKAYLNSTDTPQQIMSIIDQNSGDTKYGQQITSVQTNLYMTPTFTGNIGSWSIIGGTFSIQITDSSNGGAIVYGPSSMAISPISPLPSLTNGQAVIVCSSTANGNTVPFSSVSYVQGHTYVLTDTITGYKIQGTFSDGASFGPISASTATITWTYQYQSSNTFSGVSVSFAMSGS